MQYALKKSYADMMSTNELQRMASGIITIGVFWAHVFPIACVCYERFSPNLLPTFTLSKILH